MRFSLQARRRAGAVCAKLAFHTPKRVDQAAPATVTRHVATLIDLTPLTWVRAPSGTPGALIRKVREGALCDGMIASGASSSADYWATRAARLLDVFG